MTVIRLTIGKIYIGHFSAHGKIYIDHFSTHGNIYIGRFSTHGNIYIGHFSTHGNSFHGKVYPLIFELKYHQIDFKSPVHPGANGPEAKDRRESRLVIEKIELPFDF